MNSAQSALAQREQGVPGHSYIGWQQNFCFQYFAKILRNFPFCVLWNFPRILLNSKLFCQIFAKFEENFGKHEIKNFAKLQKRNISQPPYSYTICRLLLTLPSCLLEDSSMQCGNAILRWRRIRNHTFPFCHLLFCAANQASLNVQTNWIKPIAQAREGKRRTNCHFIFLFL